MAAISGAVVKRYDNAGNVGQSILVNYVYAPKSAILKDIVDKANHIKFPIVAVSMKGFKRSAERVKNKLDGYYKQNIISDNTFTKVRSPVPVDITFELHAMSVFQSDLEQIITNWAAYFDPYIVVSWKEPHTGYELRSKIIWGGDGNITYPDQQTGATPYRLELTATFTFEGWLFKAEPEEIGKICCIDTEWNILSSQFCVMGDSIPWDADQETFNISGVPSIQEVSPLIITMDKSWNMSVIGNLLDIKSVFVSANNSDMFPMEEFDYFPDNEDYPPFFGYPITNFLSFDNNINFDVLPLTTGRFDIIAVNECGYSSMIESMTGNPYPVDTYSYDLWESASLSGIEVISKYELSCSPCSSI